MKVNWKILGRRWDNPTLQPSPLTKRNIISKASFVKLVVHDITGREIETLVSQNMNAGVYKADWDASKYSSGVYFYKIEAGGFTEVKKMILVK